MKFSIVIPAHNEEERLPPVLEAYASFFTSKMGNDAEIVLVANGCTDETATVAQNIAEKHSNIRVIDEPRKIGKGGAVILGVKESVGDYIGFVDADGATSAEEFYRLYEKSLGKDGVIGSRWIKGADVTIPQKAMRLLSSRAFNWITRILLGLKYKDTQCGAKIFTKKAWQTILPNIGTTRFAFDVDVLFQLKRAAYSITEEPTVWKDVEGSTVQFFSSSMDMFLAVVRMRLVNSPFKFVVPIYERFFSRIVEFLRRDELFCHASMLFMASMVTNVCNVSYQMVVSRALSKEEYALLATFLALFAIVARPLGTLGTAIIHYTSLLCQEGRKGAIKRLMIKWVVLTGIPALVFMGICLSFSRVLADFFHLDRLEPVIVSALAIPVMFVAPVISSALNGMQRFGWVALFSGISSVARLAFGAAFVLLVFPACGWALAGHVGGMYTRLALTTLILISILRKFKPDHSKLPSLRFYLVQCFFIQVCVAILLTGDVVLMKHYLPDEVDFAYAATLGRLVVFIVVAVVAAMFPKVSSSGAFTDEQKKVYYRSMFYTCLIMLSSVAACTLFPELLHRFLYKIQEPSAHLISLTRWMAIIMSVATLMNINLTLLLAQRRFKLASAAIPGALLYLGGVHFYHETPYAILLWAGGAISLVFIVTMIGIIRDR